MAVLNLVVNGEAKTLEVNPAAFLADVLREQLGLTGTKIGCNEAECGICTVLLDGTPILSCVYPALKAQGKHIETIEGLAKTAQLHPLQQAFIDHGAVQCGFCTPGMIMSAIDIVRRNGYDLDEKTIRKQLTGNICRCTGYHNIVLAIQAGAADMKPG